MGNPNQGSVLLHNEQKMHHILFKRSTKLPLPKVMLYLFLVRSPEPCILSTIAPDKSSIQNPAAQGMGYPDRSLLAQTVLVPESPVHVILTTNRPPNVF